MSELIHIHKLDSLINLCSIVYRDYLDENQYLRIIECLFHYYYNKKEILLPFSINSESKVILFYNIYKKFNFKKLDTILKTLNNLKYINISYVSFNSKINPNLKPTILPSNFDTFGNINLNMLNSYLKESSYKVFNLEDNGIVKE